MTSTIVGKWAGAWLVLLVATGLLPAGAVPRYDLKPGQVLTYEATESFKGKDRSSSYKTTWRLWVVGRNDDGSWRIVARTALATLGEQGSPARDEMVSFARLDLRPDGEVAPCATLGTHVDPTDAARLPRAPVAGLARQVRRAGLPDPDHHRPAGQSRRYPRRLLAATFRGGDGGGGSAARGKVAA